MITLARLYCGKSSEYGGMPLVCKEPISHVIDIITGIVGTKRNTGWSSHIIYIEYRNRNRSAGHQCDIFQTCDTRPGYKKGERIVEVTNECRCVFFGTKNIIE